MRAALLVTTLVLAPACATSSAGPDASGSVEDGGGDGDGGSTGDAAARADASATDASIGPDACMTGTVNSCASCGDVCPGVGVLNGAPACESMTCVFRCAGENYDVDGDIGTGCEQSDAPTGNHSSGGAVDLGSMPCNDGSSNPNISGVMVSDAREHSPAILGFNATTGSAPDYYTIYADGGTLCQNDINISLVVSGSSSPTCYKLTADTSKGPYTCQTSSGGSCSISKGSGSYNDNTTILIKVEKTCPASSVRERVTYTVTGHL